MLVGGRWLVLCVLFVERTVMACRFQTVASTAPFLIGSLAIDYTQLGTLIGSYMLPGIFIALPGGMLGQHFGAKRLVLAGLLLMAAGGTPMGAGCNFLLVAIGRPISGGYLAGAGRHGARSHGQRGGTSVVRGGDDGALDYRLGGIPRGEASAAGGMTVQNFCVVRLERAEFLQRFEYRFGIE